MGLLLKNNWYGAPKKNGRVLQKKLVVLLEKNW